MKQYNILDNEIKNSLSSHYQHHTDGTQIVSNHTMREIKDEDGGFPTVRITELNDNGAEIIESEFVYNRNSNNQLISRRWNKFIYDNNGNLISHIYKRFNDKNKTVYSEKKRYSAGSEQMISQTNKEFSYDDKGKLTATYAFDKDENGQRIGGINRFFKYNADGEKIYRIDKPYKGNLIFQKELTYGRSSDGQWVLVKDTENKSHKKRSVDTLIAKALVNNDIELLTNVMPYGIFS